MNVSEWYVGFHPRATWRDLRGGASWTMAFGHVEAWGCTGRGDWLFFDPQAVGTKLWITHLYDEVDERMAERFLACRSVLALPAADRVLRHPLHPTMTCAAQVGHLLGVRAYAPWSLHRKLAALGAREVLHGNADERAEGRPGGESIA